VSVVVVVENPTPSTLTVTTASGSIIDTVSETYVISVADTDSLSLISTNEQGPRGPPGEGIADEIIDLTVWFENKLV
jgi:hypothetical protein